MPYSTIVQGWHDVYIVAGTASATLLGLLFVSLSLHLRAVLARPEVRGLARATFANFALVLLVALLVIIPQDSRSLGLQLEITGIASAAISALPALGAARSPTRTIRSSLLVLRFGLSFLGYAGTVAAGALLTAASFTAAFSILTAVIIALIILSLRNTWDLLVSVGASIMGHDPGAHG